jgi:hypothetical protein
MTAMDGVCAVEADAALVLATIDGCDDGRMKW